MTIKGWVKRTTLQSSVVSTIVVILALGVHSTGNSTLTVILVNLILPSFGLTFLIGFLWACYEARKETAEEEYNRKMEEKSREVV